MSMLDFTVTPDGGDPYKLQAGTRDILRWERAVRGASFNALMRDMHMVDLYRVAHIASTRQGLFTGTLAQFEETCELERVDEEDEEPDPTPPAP